MREGGRREGGREGGEKRGREGGGREREGGRREGGRGEGEEMFRGRASGTNPYAGCAACAGHEGCRPCPA